MTWEEGPRTEPRTCDLCCIAEFQPHEPRNRPHSFVPHHPLCASHGCAASVTCELEAGTSVEDSSLPTSLRWIM